MFIQTETTPNPATLKFLPGRVMAEGGPREFRSAEEAKASPLAEAPVRDRRRHAACSSARTS